MFHVRDNKGTTNVSQECVTITCVNSLAERMKYARDQRGLTQPSLAKLAGVSQGTIGNLEAGLRKMPRDIVALADALHVRAQWLATGEGPMRPSGAVLIDLEANPDYPAIRRVRFRLSAGASGFGVEYTDEDAAPIVFQRAWFESRGYKPAKLFAVRVANGSMEPGLYDGDTVVVDTEDTQPADGAVFAVNYEGELVIKRLVRDAGQWWLSSDNPNQAAYPRKVCDAGSIILGRIVHKQSEKI